MNSSKQVGAVINSLNDLRSTIRAGRRGLRCFSFFSLGHVLGFSAERIRDFATLASAG